MKGTHKILNVYWDHELVGRLWSGDNEPLNFAYSERWIENKRPPISLSIPVREGNFTREAQAFFGNLLPEGDFRHRIEQLFKVSADNDFSLLAEIGGDCAGALTIGHEAEDSEAAFYESVSEDALTRIVKSEGIAGLGQPGQRNRLSLAGAQGKLPVRFFKDQFEIPHLGAPSTHILKFNRPSGEYPRLVENEYYMNRAAHYLGLKVVNCQLLRTDHGTILVIERYDRSADEWPQRFHQEDFCQALGYSYQKKYEKEGGPSFAACIQLARDRLGILDVNRLIDWFLFNLFMGNSDAHAKNISILHSKRTAYSLAPFYDLVCTRAYELLDRKLAMACGQEFEPDRVSLENLRRLAQETGITFRLLKNRVKPFLEHIPLAMQRAKADLQSQGFAVKDIQNVEQNLTKIHRGFVKRLTA